MTNDLTLPAGATLPARLIIRAAHLTINGNGARLVGPGRVGEEGSLAEAGVGVLIEGTADVTVKNLKVAGFATGLLIRHAQAATIEGCDLSDNYHNPKHGWGELPPRGGIRLESATFCVLRANRANRVWNALELVDSDDNLVIDNDFSLCSNTCAKLWKSSRNRFLTNNLSYGLRIDRAAGEVHARDSTCVLIETGSDSNYWYRNDITHGGDGVFIRPLNRWVSRGNVFIENDTSYANNNCVESWSPGNSFIRNRANHGSYGFWLGGSDQTVLIGNEAAYNGLTNGFHNAPEPGFRHGGIVIVSGSSSHTLVQGNDLHDNNGAGLVFRGDVASRGQRWRTEHWIVQQNQIHDNRFGVWGRWGADILFAGNVFTNNIQGNVITNVSDMIELPSGQGPQVIPTAEVVGPEVVATGEQVQFDARSSQNSAGHPLKFHWQVKDRKGDQPVFETTFREPGLHRVCLTVDNGSLGGMAWRDVLAVEPVAQELGTEGQAARWGFELEGNDDGRGRVTFADDVPGLVGNRCLRFTPNPYPGAYATAIYPKSRDAGWDLAGKTRLRFWIRTQNPNVPGWQNAGPVIRLIGSTGQVEFRPVKDGNVLNDPPDSEARWLWMPIIVPLAGDAAWQRTSKGEVNLHRIDALSLSLDSWGGEPFTVWLDGLTVD